MTATLKQITLTTLCALTFPILGYAQQVKAPTYVAKGVLIDSLSHEPAAFATVRLMEGGKAIKVGTTEANGRFSICAPKAGNYELELFAMGKAPVGVARLGKKHGARTIAFAGSVTKEATACNKAGIDAFFPIIRGISTLEEAMDPQTAKSNMTACAEQVFRLF